MLRLSKEDKKRLKELSDANEDKVRQYFKDLNYSVLKLDINNDSKLPDFLATKSNRKLYIEVKSLLDQESIANQWQVVKIIKDNFDNITSKIDRSYSLNFSDKLIGMPEQNIGKSVRFLRKEFKDFVQINPNSVFRSNDGLFVITPVDSPSAPVIFYPHNVVSLLDVSRIRDRIDNADKQFEKFKNDTSPKIVIIFKNGIMLDTSEMIQSIHGLLTEIPSSACTVRYTTNRKGACFQHNKNTSISAVCFTGSIRFHGKYLDDSRFVILHNPFSKSVLPKEIFDQVGNVQMYFNMTREENQEIMEINYFFGETKDIK